MIKARVAGVALCALAALAALAGCSSGHKAAPATHTTSHATVTPTSKPVMPTVWHVTDASGTEVPSCTNAGVMPCLETHGRSVLVKMAADGTGANLSYTDGQMTARLSDGEELPPQLFHTTGGRTGALMQVDGTVLYTIMVEGGN
jgi:hypothetical protein